MTQQQTHFIQLFPGFAQLYKDPKALGRCRPCFEPMGSCCRPGWRERCMNGLFATHGPTTRVVHHFLGEQPAGRFTGREVRKGLGEAPLLRSNGRQWWEAGYTRDIWLSSPHPRTCSTTPAGSGVNAGRSAGNIQQKTDPQSTRQGRHSHGTARTSCSCTETRAVPCSRNPVNFCLSGAGNGSGKGLSTVLSKARSSRNQPVAYIKLTF